MSKKKKTPAPIIYPGISLPLDHSDIPDQWLPDDDFSSHRPMLYRAIMNTPHDEFAEFGIGFGSTPMLSLLYHEHFPKKELFSFENNIEWFEKLITDEYIEPVNFLTYAFIKNHHMICHPNLMVAHIGDNAILFIDCAPGELRKHLISKHSSKAKLIIVHDTESGAEYVYGMTDILNSFKFRCDLIVEGGPQTTVVSNLYDFDNWKTIVNEQIRFI